MKKTALILMIFTIISKIFGFGREIALSYFYGASNISDAYLISLTIPGTIFSFVGAAIATSFIPMYTEIENKFDVKTADDFTSNIINFILLIATIISMLVLRYTSTVVKLFATGFEGETLELAIKYTEISIFGILFSGIVYVFIGYLQIKNKFFFVAVLGIVFNISVVTFIVMSSLFNENLLPWGIVFAMASEFILLTFFVYKVGYRYKFHISIRDKNVNKIAVLALPVVLGTSVNQINTLIDRNIASRIAIGSISALNYADKLNSFVQGIFVISIATVIYPLISKMVVKKDEVGFKKVVLEALISVSLLVTPVIIGTMIFSEQIIQFLFGRGAFDEEAILMTSSVLFFYSIGMIGVGFREILSKVFYSLQDTKTPMFNATIGVALNIVLNIVLSKYLGIIGLALATSISAILVSISMFLTLRKKIGAFGLRNFLSTFIKILLSSLVMGGVSKLSFVFFVTIFNDSISLVLAVLIGFISYMMIVYNMKIKEVDVISNLFVSRFKNKY